MNELDQSVKEGYTGVMGNNIFIQEDGKTDTEKYLTVQQFANLFGVSRQTVWHLMKRYRIPTKTLGTMKLIRKSDAKRFTPHIKNTQVRIRLKESAILWGS